MWLKDFLLNLEFYFQLPSYGIPWLMPVVMGMFGGIFGSFLTCAVWRVPRGESLWFPPSHCPSCDSKLKVVDLFPVFSYVFSGGKCRHCGKGVPIQYFIIEVISVFLGVVSVFFVGSSVLLIFLFPALLGLQFVGTVLVLEKILSFKVLLFSIILLLLLAVVKVYVLHF